jgi:hypothetical protein
MNCDVEMGSDALIYIPSFIKSSSAIQKLMGGGNTHIDTQTHTHTKQCDLISLLFFFQNKECRRTKVSKFHRKTQLTYKVPEFYEP